MEKREKKKKLWDVKGKKTINCQTGDEEKENIGKEKERESKQVDGKRKK